MTKKSRTRDLATKALRAATRRAGRDANELDLSLRRGAYTKDGPYKIKGLMGQGGMGIVYEAEDTNLHMRVALKFLAPQAKEDLAGVELFLREARTIASLSHPNIVQIHYLSVKECFFAMEFLRTGSVGRRLVTAGALRPQEVKKLLIPVCDALAYAHDEGIVHRDLKPSNILLAGRGQPKLSDFGLARGVREAAGDLIGGGTAGFVAPEQAAGAKADPRADIYSLGASIYSMLTAEVPEDIQAELPKKKSITRKFKGIIRRCTAKDRRKRYSSAEDVLKAVVAL